MSAARQRSVGTTGERTGRGRQDCISRQDECSARGRAASLPRHRLSQRLSEGTFSPGATPPHWAAPTCLSCASWEARGPCRPNFAPSPPWQLTRSLRSPVSRRAMVDSIFCTRMGMAAAACPRSVACCCSCSSRKVDWPRLSCRAGEGIYKLLIGMWLLLQTLWGKRRMVWDILEGGARAGTDQNRPQARRKRQGVQEAPSGHLSNRETARPACQASSAGPSSRAVCGSLPGGSTALWRRGRPPLQTCSRDPGPAGWEQGRQNLNAPLLPCSLCWRLMAAA